MSKKNKITPADGRIVTVNKERMAQALEDISRRVGLSKSELSLAVGGSKNYLRAAAYYGKIREGVLDKLVRYYGLNRDEIIVTEEIPAEGLFVEVPETKPQETVPGAADLAGILNRILQELESIRMTIAERERGENKE